MVQSIIREATLQKDYVSGEISTIYFGGGTPSLLRAADIQSILETLYRTFSIAADAEVTLETNPDDCTLKSLSDWKQTGINRLSIGVQSFFEDDLQWMNRAHSSAQAVNAIQFAQESGFDNITIDLIYGTPTLSNENWEQNIDKALSLQVPHLSCYALTVEPRTALDKMIKTQQMENVDAEKQSVHFSILTTKLAAAGFEHYEISNFAKPGFRSRHNSSYWQGKSYLGLGPSAHSFNGSTRQWNVANNNLYQQAISMGTIPFEAELLTSEQRLNEYIMTALRTMEGIEIRQIQNKWGEKQAAQLRTSVKKHIDRGHVILTEERIQLTEEGKFLADGIASDLFTLA